ncbi:hypothetical protein QOT17_019866 [Balamuthia mandrillaris]
MAEYRLECQDIKPKIGIEEQTCHHCGDMLSKLIADEFVLMTKAGICKHNVLGKRREMLKDLFKECTLMFCEGMEKSCKELRNLGYRVPHIPEKLHLTRISPSPKGEKWPDADTMIQNLLDDCEKVTQYLYRDAKKLDETCKCPDIKDFLAELIRCHKEICKKLRCHLERKGGSMMSKGSSSYY